MPFFYSQHLRDDQRPILEPQAHAQGRTVNPITGLPRGGGRLVWHSNTGASGKRNTNTETTWQYKPVRPSAPREKVVSFSTIEVQPYHLDRSLTADVFYTRAELQAFRKGRFDDATAIRARRDGAPHPQPSVDDVGIATRPRSGSVANLLSLAFEDDAQDDAQGGELSIRGVEHFVYPALQQEMIRRKKEVQREVLDFARSKRADPQGWRLAELSRARSRWARAVATEKAHRWCGGDAGPGWARSLSRRELEGFEQSRDELDRATRSLKGSVSCDRLDRQAGPAPGRRASVDGAPSSMAWLSSQSHDELDGTTGPWEGRAAGDTEKRDCSIASSSSMLGLSSKSYDELDQSTEPWKGNAGVAAEGGGGGDVAPRFAVDSSSTSHDSSDRYAGPWEGAATVANKGGRGGGAASSFAMGLSSRSYDELDQSTEPWKGSNLVVDLSSKSFDELDLTTVPWKGSANVAVESVSDPATRSSKGSAGVADKSRPMAWLSSKSHDELDQSTTPWEGGSSFVAGSAQATRSPKRSTGVADEGGCSSGASSRSMAWLSSMSHDELDLSTTPWEGDSSFARKDARATWSPKESAGLMDKGGCSGGASPVSPRSKAWLSSKTHDKLAQSARRWKRSAGSAVERRSNQGAKSLKGSAGATVEGGCPSRSLAWLSSKSHDELDHSVRPWNQVAMGLSSKSHDELDQTLRPWKGSSKTHDKLAQSARPWKRSAGSAVKRGNNPGTKSSKGSAGATDEGECLSSSLAWISSKSPDDLDQSALPWNHVAMGLSSKSHDQLDQSLRPWKGSAGFADERKGAIDVSPGVKAGTAPPLAAVSAPRSHDAQKIPEGDVTENAPNDDCVSLQSAGASTGEK